MILPPSHYILSFFKDGCCILKHSRYYSLQTIFIFLNFLNLSSISVNKHGSISIDINFKPVSFNKLGIVPMICIDSSLNLPVYNFKNLITYESRSSLSSNTRSRLSSDKLRLNFWRWFLDLIIRFLYRSLF